MEAGKLHITCMTLHDIFIENEKLRKEWAADLNTEVPSSILSYSTQKVWWRCEKGHEWQAQVNSRTGLGRGCPYCSGHKPIVGETDLATTNPKLAKEWHPERNEDLRPSDVSGGSGKKVWWRCENGHEWQARVTTRASVGYGCPYCSGRKPVAGETDLATTNPELAKEWHPERNGDLHPSNVTPGSGKKVWWRCELGHEWQARVFNRVRGGSCPACNPQRRKAAKPPKPIFYGDSDVSKN